MGRNHQYLESRREREEAAYWNRKRKDEKDKMMKAREDRLRIDEIKKRANDENCELEELLLKEGKHDLLERIKLDNQSTENESVIAPHENGINHDVPTTKLKVEYK